MKLEILKSKIHRATVTDANLDYVGSITLDEDLMKMAHLHEFVHHLIVRLWPAKLFGHLPHINDISHQIEGVYSDAIKKGK